MPVIVIGADTPIGDAIVDALLPNAVEVRAFISDETRTIEFKQRGTKVATGDVSDASHVEGASMRCFCAVLVIEAATDDRERSFAPDGATVTAGWAEAIRASGIRRAIWVGSAEAVAEVPQSVDEVAVVIVDGDLEAAAQEVADLEEAATIPG
jgi:nucleoside-diphosphate-sugar epimerase